MDEGKHRAVSGDAVVQQRPVRWRDYSALRWLSVTLLVAGLILNTSHWWLGVPSIAVAVALAAIDRQRRRYANPLRRRVLP